MKMTALTTALLVALLAGTTACDGGTARQPADNASANAEASRTNIDKAMDKARQKLAEGNISVSHDDKHPKAEITPKGDLLIGGKAVALTPQQRARVLEYRTHVIGVASAGIDVGAQGANLAMHAMGEALRGVFSGKPDEIEARVDKQADGVRLAALKICERLPAMKVAQQKLAAEVPEFAPYATMTDEDIVECRKDVTSDISAKRHMPTPPEPPAPPPPPAG